MVRTFRLIYNYNITSEDAINNVIGFKPLFESTQAEISIPVPAELNPSQSLVIPSYGVGVDKDTGELVLAALRYDDESGNILFPTSLDDNGNPKILPLAVVFDHAFPGEDRRRYAAVVEPGSDALVYNIKTYIRAPGRLVITDENGDVVWDVVLGNPIAAIGGISLSEVAAGIIKGLIVSGVMYLGSKLFDWLTNREKTKQLEIAEELAKDNGPQVFTYLESVGGNNLLGQADGWLSKLKDIVLGGFGAIIGTIIMVLKLQVIADLVRSLFRRG